MAADKAREFDLEPRAAMTSFSKLRLHPATPGRTRWRAPQNS
ncbi:MAG: hypothetical protein RMM30_07505 [Armatimonadota bacterium]|nr:hypothetical protein [Armatimonadota bacterium]MDW8156412.1 hypothetical protein [Armatimonadota bacterium]